MKFRTLILSTFAFTLAFVSCSKDEYPNPYESGDKYILSSQDEIASFKGSDDVNTVIIDGENITDLSTLNLQTVKYLTIKNTSVKSIDIPSLESVTASLIIDNNAQLKDISGLKNLKFVVGEVVVKNNKILDDISGLMNLKIFNGQLLISNNSSLGENVVPLPDDTFGFGPIRYLANNGILEIGKVTLENNHPKSVTDPSFIGIPVGETIIDYTLKSKADVEKFICFNEDGIVNNLSILGADIDTPDLNSLIGKIKEVRGTLRVENIKANDTGRNGFFGKIKFDGDIILRNLPMNNINSFQGLKDTLEGSLIIENCNNINFAWDGFYPNGAGFQNIKKINGSLIIRNCAKFSGRNFKYLTEVGGDFIIDKGPEQGEALNNLRQIPIERIGGNLIIQNCASLTSFQGIQNLKKVEGKKVVVKANVALQNADGGKPGFCWFKWAKENGVFAEDCEITLAKLDGTPIDFDQLQPCPNCPHK